MMCLTMFEKYANDDDDYDEQLFRGGGWQNMYLSLCCFFVGMFGLKSWEKDEDEAECYICEHWLPQ